MKLDKYKFARLVQFISQHRDGEWLDLEELDSLVDVEAPLPQKVNVDELDSLLKHMAEGKSKIEAIKSYRFITGMGLKESKDAVERYWSSDVKYYVDILNKVRDALGTAEIGEALVEVARNAHKAEQELGARFRNKEWNIQNDA